MFSLCADCRVVWCGLQRFLLIWLLAVGLAPAAHAQRVALLVGNASYSSAPLRNPPNDVREMEAALTAVGFKVSKVLNANQSQLKRAVRDFGNSARGAEMALLYYSGHGTQVRGENYLIPVGASIEKESDYEIEAVSANAVLAQLREVQPRAAVVVLDACRDNPHVASTKSLTKGLARMDAPTGTMIAFATAPNDVAQDNGLYARVLAKNLRRPGLELLDVFRDTSSEVRRQSGGQQVPRVSEVSIDQRIYLAGPGVAAPAGGQGGGTQVASVVPEPAPAPAVVTSSAASGSSASLIAGRYQVLGNGSEVKDTQTGLIWQRCSVGQSWTGSTCSGEAQQLDLIRAQAQARSGWRVPTVREVHSIVVCSSGKTQQSQDPKDGGGALAKLCDGDYQSPTISQVAFPGTPQSFYWSSSPYVGDTSYTWAVNFSVGNVYYYSANVSGAVRLVRASQ